MTPVRRWLIVVGVFAIAFAALLVPALASEPEHVYEGTILAMALVAAGLATAVALLTGRGAGPDWAWRGGRSDPIRAAFFREDGSWRRFGRHAVVALLVVLLLLAYLGKRYAG